MPYLKIYHFFFPISNWYVKIKNQHSLKPKPKFEKHRISRKNRCFIDNTEHLYNLSLDVDLNFLYIC